MVLLISDHLFYFTAEIAENAEIFLCAFVFYYSAIRNQPIGRELRVERHSEFV